MSSSIDELFNAINGEELAGAVANAIRQALTAHPDIQPHLTFPKFEYDFTFDLSVYPREAGLIHVQTHGGDEISWMPPSETEVHEAYAETFGDRWLATTLEDRNVMVRHFRRALRRLYASNKPLNIRIRGNSNGEVDRPDLFREHVQAGKLPVVLGDETPTAPPEPERVAEVPEAYQPPIPEFGSSTNKLANDPTPDPEPNPEILEPPPVGEVKKDPTKETPIFTADEAYKETEGYE